MAKVSPGEEDLSVGHAVGTGFHWADGEMRELAVGGGLPGTLVQGTQVAFGQTVLRGRQADYVTDYGTTNSSGCTYRGGL